MLLLNSYSVIMIPLLILRWFVKGQRGCQRQTHLTVVTVVASLRVRGHDIAHTVLTSAWKQSDTPFSHKST